MDRRRSRPLVSAWTMGVLLALGACGTAEQGGPGTGETSVPQPAPGTAVPTTGEETGQTAPPSPTGGTPTPTGATGGTTTPDPSQAAPTGEPGSTPTGATTTPVAEPTLAAGSQQVLDLVLGRLDTASLDQSSQCMGSAEVAEQVGLRAGRKPHMLADGHDVWVVCLTATTTPEGSLLSLVDSAGAVWGQGSLVLVGEPLPQRAIGFQQTGTSVRAVAVTGGPELVPVGFSYERTAADGTAYQVTTLVLVVPTTRPGGEWTVTVTSADAVAQHPIATPACQPAVVAPQRPWPVDPGLRVVTFTDENALENAVTPGQLPAGLTVVDHCLATPALVGMTWQDAVQAADGARLAAGLPAGGTRLVLSCAPVLPQGVVRLQSPLPNEILQDAVVLHVDVPCPEMPNVEGMTVDQAEATLQQLARPPFSVAVRPAEECTQSSLVSSSNPVPGGTSYTVADDRVLQVQLGC